MREQQALQTQRIFFSIINVIQDCDIVALNNKHVFNIADKTVLHGGFGNKWRIIISVNNVGTKAIRRKLKKIKQFNEANL